MQTLPHLAVGLPIAAAIWVITGYGPGIAFLAATVLIDADHYLRYIFARRGLNPFSAYRYYLSFKNKKGRKKTYFFHFLHTHEVLLALFLAGFWNSIAFFILAGFLVHIALDVAFNNDTNRKRANYLRNMSMIYRLVRFKTLVNDIRL